MALVRSDPVSAKESLPYSWRRGGCIWRQAAVARMIRRTERSWLRSSARHGTSIAVANRREHAAVFAAEFDRAVLSWRRPGSSRFSSSSSGLTAKARSADHRQSGGARPIISDQPGSVLSDDWVRYGRAMRQQARRVLLQL